jgi:hypothetical protein
VPFGGCEAPPSRVWIFGGESTASVSALLNLTWGKSFLLGDAYPMTESSWCLGMYSCLALALGGDGMNSVLEYILLDGCGHLRLRPFVLGSYDLCFLRS